MGRAGVPMTLGLCESKSPRIHVIAKVFVGCASIQGAHHTRQHPAPLSVPQTHETPHNNKNALAPRFLLLSAYSHILLLHNLRNACSSTSCCCTLPTHTLPCKEQLAYPASPLPSPVPSLETRKSTCPAVQILGFSSSIAPSALHHSPVRAPVKDLI